MARDLDFRNKDRLVNTAPALRKVAVAPSSPPPPGAQKHKNYLPILILIVLGVALIAVGLYWQFLRPSPVSTVSPTPTSLAEQPASETTTTPKSENNIFAASNSPHIQIYNSGAGTSALQAVIKKLGTAGYEVENLEDSQFQYDQTYIWHHKENVELAQKIAGLLSDRKVILKESKTYGLFDILVWLGKS